VTSPSEPPKSNLTSIVAIASLAVSGVSLWSTLGNRTEDHIQAARDRIAVLDSKASSIEARINAVDGHLAYTDQRVDRLEDKFDRIGHR